MKKALYRSLASMTAQDWAAWDQKRAARNAAAFQVTDTAFTLPERVSVADTPPQLSICIAEPVIYASEGPVTYAIAA